MQLTQLQITQTSSELGLNLSDVQKKKRSLRGRYT